jgi:hypothetical protein
MNEREQKKMTPSDPETANYRDASDNCGDCREHWIDTKDEDRMKCLKKVKDVVDSGHVCNYFFELEKQVA